MKYHSNPKPVRIRIESGGEEHFSLDSLLRCFNPKDILCKKNELLRWLEFQGEEGKFICDVLYKIEDFSTDVFGVYKAFFNQYIENKHITKIEELYYSWSKEETYSNNYYFLSKLYEKETKIELGGFYFCSIEELQMHFCPLEIFKKKDELLRWLEFQGEEGERIIKELHDIKFNRDKVYAIYKAFFSTYIKEHNIRNLTELYAQWYTEKVDTDNFSFLKEFCYNDEMYLERLYTEKCTKDLESDWFSVMKSFVFKHYCEIPEINVFDIHTVFKSEIRNPNLLYFLGMMYKEINEFDKAKIILKIAEEKGCKKQIQKVINEIDIAEEKDNKMQIQELIPEIKEEGCRMKLDDLIIDDLINDIVDDRADDIISEKKDCKKTIQELINEIAVAKEKGCRMKLSNQEIYDLINDIDDKNS